MAKTPNKNRKSKPKPLTERDRLKLAIARRLGILEQVERDGWGSLSAKECGQVGGLVSGFLKEMRTGEDREKILGNAGRA